MQRDVVVVKVKHWLRGPVVQAPQTKREKYLAKWDAKPIIPRAAPDFAAAAAASAFGRGLSR